MVSLFFFFFSSRRRHTRFDCDWSSDVCSSDLDKALEQVDQSGQRWCEAEIHRSKGELLSRFSDAPQAESCLQRSLATARRQGARLWELRAACSLGRLWRDQGKGNDARDLLGPIHGWFAEGFDTPDLKEARALLDALSG